jgi:hypothetical protein
MDLLKDLPVDEKGMLSPEQKSILNKYIGGTAPNDSNSSDNKSNSSTPKWKTTLYVAAVFLALVNPVVQGLLSKVPVVGDNYVYMLTLTTLIFTLCVGAVMYLM